MKKIAVIGTEDFILGFKLAGIRGTFEIKGNTMEMLNGLKESDFGIVVVEEDFLDKLEPEERVEIENSVKPVFIPLSLKESQDSLKRLIRKSIGIDLWKE